MMRFGVAIGVLVVVAMVAFLLAAALAVVFTFALLLDDL